METNKPTYVFDLEQRKIISDALRGRLPDTVRVSNYSGQIMSQLAKWGITSDKVTIHQRIFLFTNNQDLYRAAYCVLKNERPELADDLFNGKLVSLQPA